ncbi:hypothetical protein NS383_10300 [Pseudomonas oryzihabitans]|nr:hypothetical protein NS383_10300 [Pseudomonas psychrotolerans]
MILVTGGAGFIGSHLCIQLIDEGYDIIILDNLENSDATVVSRIEEITGKTSVFLRGDVKDSNFLNSVFAKYEIHAVFHCAGKKSVKESSASPLIYYEDNVVGLVRVLQAMESFKVKSIIFSSSATVYGSDAAMPVNESQVAGELANPYARTKRMCEQILQDLCVADRTWRVGVLRYFNPIGAHQSGLIGESPNGTPNNLLPFIGKVVSGEYPFLSVYGDDYPTQDGSGVRDYIHVSDLVAGHLSAMNYINQNAGFNVWNLGAGIGYSVFQIIETFEKVSKRKISYKVVQRRAGDVAKSWADPDKAERELGWKASKNLEEMISDNWRWINGNF